jgi:TRAP-type C4-dicarboxylate transport system substrate-binding protein
MISLATILIISLLIGGCSTSTTTTPAQTTTTTTIAPPAVIELSSAQYLPPAHPFSPLQGEWGKEIEKRTAGRVKITYYPGGSLIKAPGTADGIEQGIVDIGFSHIGYTPGRFPVTEALDLPMGYPTGWVGSHVATDFIANFKPAEWNNMHVLLVNAGVTAGLMLHDDKVTKLEDLNGKTLRGAGEVAAAITALGATARDIPMAEMYDSVSKGVVDGTLVGIETLKSFKMAEVCKYTAFAWQVGNMYTFYLAMNIGKWNSLPPDIQKIFTEVSAEYAEKWAVAWNEADVAGIQYSLSIPGNEVYKLSDAEGKRWSATVQPVLGAYEQTMTGKGFSDPHQYIDYIRDRVAYWTAREAEQNIASPFDVELPTAE